MIVNRFQRSDIVVLLTLFVLSFAALFLLMDRALSIYDEGIPLTGGMLSSAGWMAYRDFYANYGPAQFKVVGWLINCFGPRLEVVRFYDLMVKAGIVVALFAVLRGVTGFLPALAAWASSLVWLACDGPSGYPVYPATLMILISSGFLIRGFFQDGSGPIFFVAGVIAGLAGLFRFDAGVLVCAAHGIVLLYSIFLQRSEDRLPGREFGWERILFYFAGAAVIVLPVLLFHALHENLGRLWHDTFLFPSRNYVRTRSLPLIGFDELEGMVGIRNFMVYFPPLILLLAVYSACTWKIPKFARKEMILLVCLILPLTAKGFVRTSIVHMQPAIVFSIGVLALFWGFFRFGLSNAIKTPVAIATFFLLATTFDMLMARIMETRFVTLRDIPGFISAWQADRPVGSPGGEGQSTGPAMFFVDNKRLMAIEIMDRCAGKADHIYLGRNPHDRVVTNDVISYFLLLRKPGTRWYHFDPGLQSQQSIQAQMIDDLKATRPPWIWLDSMGSNFFEPNDSALSSGVTLLDDYITGNYQPFAEVGPILILRRTDVVPPYGCQP